MPKISVIVPIYNAEKYIERCARCLFEQTLDEIEYLFIDDCSPDHSIAILEQLIKDYKSHFIQTGKKTRIVRMFENSGQAAVRKQGMQIAVGDYIIQCDSDDWIDKNMLRNMWDLAIKDNLDVVVCDYYHVVRGERIYHRGCKSTESIDIFYDVLSSSCSWAIWNKLFKRSLITDNEIVYPKLGMNMGEDMLIVCQLLYYTSFGGRIGYVNKPLYYYCQNDGSITNQANIDSIIKTTQQWASNIKALDFVFKRREYDNQIKKRILFVKYRAKKKLEPFVGNRQTARIWLSLFDDNNLAYIFCHMIPLKERVLYLKKYLMTKITMLCQS